MRNITFLALFACACPNADTDTDTDADADADTDADTDTDADSDADADTDTDTDADSDADADTDADADSDADTDADTDCPPPGIYGDPSWELEVAPDCSAYLWGFCGEGLIMSMTLAEGAFDTTLTWRWQGGGPSGGEDPATFVGTVADGVVEGTLAYSSSTSAVRAELGVTPGSGLGLHNCPLD